MQKRVWYTNGLVEILRSDTDSVPDGYYKGRLPVSDEMRKKCSINCNIKKLTPEQEAQRRLKISQTKRNKTPEQKAEYSRHVSEATTGKHVGKDPWNKGLVGVQNAWNKNLKYSLSEDSKIRMIERRNETQRKMVH